MLPEFQRLCSENREARRRRSRSHRVQGQFIRDVLKLNADSRNFRVFSPDETSSNRWGAVFDVTNRCSTAEILPIDDHVSPDGRVMEVLSEHQCEGWLEGYLLTGRHGFFSCYEAFIHIIDSMFNQHAKWLKVCNDIPWRRPIASLNYLLTSHVWRQDHNGFSHQDPGFIDHVVNKKAEVIRVYLPPDANTLLSVTDHCLRSRNYVNVVVVGKQPAPQWLDMDAAVKHCTAGLGIWPWASNDQGCEPDVVMACCGDVPTLETLAAVQLLWDHFPELKIRMINVVDLMKLQPASEHPHGLSDKDFDVLFTKDKPIIFAFHGYPMLIHRLAYRRTNHANLHVRGFKEEGTTTTPFDMVVRNDLDRYRLVGDVIDRLPQLGSRGAYAKQALRDKIDRSRIYCRPWPGSARNSQLEMARENQIMSEKKRVVFLFDVDNTLLDTDRVTEDLKRHLEKEVGAAGSQLYWRAFEKLRTELGYADYLGALQSYRHEHPHDLRILILSQFLIDYPFANRLFPHSLDVIERVKQWGPAAILSDGDVVFQPRKVARAGLFEAVEGNVLIYVHKEQELDDVARRFPAEHYVVVDDKLRILTAIKKIWGQRVSTVFVRQGHYAHDPKILTDFPPADMSFDQIGDLLTVDFSATKAAGFDTR